MENVEYEKELRKLGLKTQALLERVSTLASEYENKVADLRVELTIVTEDRDNLRNTLVERTNDEYAEIVEEEK